eukprot:1156284-Pelagomonas_calceolata.AAC.3
MDTKPFPLLWQLSPCSITRMSHCGSSGVSGQVSCTKGVCPITSFPACHALANSVLCTPTKALLEAIHT